MGRRRGGFTLIELLVVIAIIAILAAILFPVFARAREKARQSSCLSNVKQLMLAVMMYAQDYDETLPYASSWGVSGEPSNITWYQALMPYAKNSQIVICPSYPNQSIGYGWNYQNFGYRTSAGNMSRDPGCKLAEIPVPAGTILIGDDPDQGFHDAGGIYIYGPSQFDLAGDPTSDPDVANLARRHNGGGNYGFCDGHAKWMGLLDLMGKDSLWTKADD
jgi:prepilin-type N-terminal cleavage/methylation domain-containing protein/prepilin-type processing-associated H-X9-DG protein